ncbi:hypothetical protein GCM10027200_44710 [Lentzea nigeriaca]
MHARLNDLVLGVPAEVGVVEAEQVVVPDALPAEKRLDLGVQGQSADLHASGLYDQGSSRADASSPAARSSSRTTRYASPSA